MMVTRCLYLAVVVCAGFVSACTPISKPSDVSYVVVDGDEHMNCQQIAQAFYTVGDFGRDAAARKRQLEYMSREKDCSRRNISVNISGTFYSD